MVIRISMAISIYFGDWIKTVLLVNLLFFLLLVQVIYVGIRWHVKAGGKQGDIIKVDSLLKCYNVKMEL